MKTKVILIAIALFSAIHLLAAPPVSEGKVIFSARCAGCHNINKIITGPALAGVDQRHDMDWIVKFIQSSQSVIQSGDKEAVVLFEKFNRIPMPDHKDLSAENVKSIVDYIKSEAKPVEAEKAPFARLGKVRPAYKPLSVQDAGYFATYLALVAFLVAGLLFAVQVKELQRNRKSAIAKGE